MLIHWTISGYETTDGFDLDNPFEQLNLTGWQIDISPNPSAAPTGRDKYLHYDMRAQITKNGVNYSDGIFVEQDEIDKCRQEYIDMGRNYKPTRANFMNSQGSEHFTLAELSITSHYGTWAVYIQPAVTVGLEAVRAEVGHALTINSGYRNPMKQLQVSSGAPNGIHQYGAAVDVQTPDFNGDGVLEQDEWEDMKTAAHHAGACVEPADYDGRKPVYYYIHMDWPTGSGGARSVCPENW